MNAVELKLKLSFSSCVFDVLLTSEFLSNSFTVDPHIHTHPFHEFYYIEQGVCRLRWNDRELFCPEGTVLLIPPHTPHVVLPEEEDPVTRAFLYKSNTTEKAADLTRLFSVTEPVAFCDDSGYIRNALMNIRRELKERSPFFHEKVRGEMILLFARAACILAPNTVESRREQGESRAQTIENYIADHCFDPNASMTELASSLHLSPRQLHRQCLSFFGVPFRTKLYQTRMEIAKYRLEKKGESVASLSRELGYATPSGFSAAYKRYFGTYPTGKKRMK